LLFAASTSHPSSISGKEKDVFKDPRFLFLLKNVLIPAEVKDPEQTLIVMMPSQRTFGQFYKRHYWVSTFAWHWQT